MENGECLTSRIHYLLNSRLHNRSCPHATKSIGGLMILLSGFPLKHTTPFGHHIARKLHPMHSLRSTIDMHSSSEMRELDISLCICTSYARFSLSTQTSSEEEFFPCPKSCHSLLTLFSTLLEPSWRSQFQLSSLWSRPPSVGRSL